jgi:hypothetical protein
MVLPVPGGLKNDDDNDTFIYLLIQSIDICSCFSCEMNRSIYKFIYICLYDTPGKIVLPVPGGLIYIYVYTHINICAYRCKCDKYTYKHIYELIRQYLNDNCKIIYMYKSIHQYV